VQQVSILALRQQFSKEPVIWLYSPHPLLGLRRHSRWRREKASNDDSFGFKLRLVLWLRCRLFFLSRHSWRLRSFLDNTVLRLYQAELIRRHGHM
jgi:hypothetical protein